MAFKNPILARLFGAPPQKLMRNRLQKVQKIIPI